MAKPIPATPTLEGKALEEFLKEMKKPPSKKKVERFERIMREIDGSHIHMLSDPDYEFPPVLRKNGKIE